MNENDIHQIRVNNHLIGIVGLESVIDAMARDFASCDDDEIGEEIIRRIKAKNYIPQNAHGLYKAALVREFRKRLGQPVAEEALTGLHVVILGPGCAQCDRMEADVREVMADMRLAAELVHETSPREIARYGVMGLPALIINDEVVCVGQAPNRNKIREWLQARKK